MYDTRVAGYYPEWTTISREFARGGGRQEDRHYQALGPHTNITGAETWHSVQDDSAPFLMKRDLYSIHHIQPFTVLLGGRYTNTCRLAIVT